MLIPALFVGDRQETDEPNDPVAGWSLATGTAYGRSNLFLLMSRRRSVVTDQPAQRGPNDYLITD